MEEDGTVKSIKIKEVQRGQKKNRQLFASQRKVRHEKLSQK